MRTHTTEFELLPPAAIDAEQCLIGSMMLFDGEQRKVVFARIQEMVAREAFYRVDHQVLFDVLVSMEQKGLPTDSIALREELAKRKLLEDIGGTPYLGELLTIVPTRAHWEHYARIVAEKHKLRMLIQVATGILRAVNAPTQMLDPAEDIINHAQSEMASIAQAGRIETWRTLGEIVSQYLEKRKSPTSSDERIDTGLKDLDALIGGLELGLTYMIGGRPGQGKSQLLKQILLNIANRATPVALITIEERGEKVGRNMLSNESRVSNNKIAYRRESEEEWKEVELAAQCLAALPFLVEDSSETISAVVNRMTIFAIEKKVKVIGIDYLQLIDPGKSDNGREDEIRRMSRAIKLAAKRLNIAVIVCVQLNRGNETGGVRKPELRDLRGSGSIEQDGDVIILCHRDDYYNYKEEGFTPTRILEAIVAKNKDNSPGIVPLFFDGEHQAVQDIDQKPVDPEEVP